MKDNPCGCELENQARLKAKDEIGLEVLTEAAKIEQKKWGCPCAGFKPNEELTESQVDTIRQIQVTTGIELFDEGKPIFNTCPNYSFNRSSVIGNDIVRAATARKYRDTGQLAIVEDLPLLNTMFEAMELLDEGYNEATAKLYEIQKKESDIENQKYADEFKKKYRD